MKKPLTIITFLLLYSFNVMSQLIIETGVPPANAYADWLVKNVLFGGGEGFEVSNVQFTGQFSTTSGSAIGTFKACWASNFPLNEGIILSTGNVKDAVGPNDVTNKSTNWNRAGDIDLDNLMSPYKTYDAAVLEFDFISEHNYFEFKYIYGSEEYPEWISDDFNDVFATFITGPNPNGGNYDKKNICDIPSMWRGAMPYFLGNNYLIYNNNGQFVQYDAYTIPLTAKVNVVPGLTYHVKIAIADALDGIYDAGLFLTSSLKSFDNNPTIIPINAGNNKTITLGDTTTLTATGGTSYFWSTGASVATIKVSPTVNTTYFVTATKDGCTASDSVIVFVNDFTIDAGANKTICSGTSTTLTATGTNSYKWSNDSTKASITVSPTITTTYYVTGTNNTITAIDSVIVTVIQIPIANAGVDKTITLGDTTTLTATGGSTYQWSTGDTTNIIKVTPTIITTYTITVANDMCTANTHIIVDVKDSLKTILFFDKIVTAYDLVSKLVGNSHCISFSNAKYTGSYYGKAIFNGTSAMGINEGIILCTGDVEGANTNMPYPQIYDINNNTSGDADLDAYIAPLKTYDAAVLEFDFVPLSDSVFFNYVFASEEYHDLFEGYNISDLFAIFISGSGINGEENIATIPETDIPISTASIGRDTNSQYYYDNNYRLKSGYRGWTSLFRSGIKVKFGEKYHVKIVIADAFNKNVDSGVFLGEMECAEPLVFTSTIYSSNPLNPDAKDVFYSDCNEDIVIKVKSSKLLDEDINITLNISGTAIKDIDYIIETTSININSGTDSVIFSITLLDNNTDYKYKTMQIEYSYKYSDFSPINSNSFIIKKLNNNIIWASDTIISLGDTTTLTATGGSTYQWSTDDTTSIIKVAPTETTTYTVTVATTMCTASDAVVVHIDAGVFVRDLKKNKSIVNIYPNPITDGNINISTENIEYPIIITITDAIGRTIKSETISSKANTTIGLEDVNKGVYFIRIQSKDFINTRKIIVN